MGWEFKNVAAISSLSGRAFQPGEKVICILFKDAQGQLQRLDLGVEEAETVALPSEALGKWTCFAKHHEPQAKEKPKWESAEALFLSLFLERSDPTTDTAYAFSPEREALKQILALLLERKRILKPQGKPKSLLQAYIYPKTQEIYKVPIGGIAGEVLEQVRSQMRALL